MWRRLEAMRTRFDRNFDEQLIAAEHSILAGEATPTPSKVSRNPEAATMPMDAANGSDQSHCD